MVDTLKPISLTWRGLKVKEVDINRDNDGQSTLTTLLSNFLHFNFILVNNKLVKDLRGN